MFTKAFSAAAAVLAAASVVSAQTHSTCDPTKKSGCPKNKAFGSTPVDLNFSEGLSDSFYEFPGTKVSHDERGAIFEIGGYNDAPTIGSHKYLFFGRVDLEVQASPGQGIITSFVLQSDDLDEIDWEWLGVDTEKTQVQSNYFGKGDTTTYDRGGKHTAPGAPDLQTSIHTYSIDWTKDYVRWIIDGQTVRELKYADAQGGTRFPQTPLQVRLGTWVAGNPKAAEGTVEWAGGMANFDGGKTYSAIYKSIKITDYSNGVKGATEYEYKDGSDGSYQSIKVLTGGSDNDDDSTTSTSSDSSSTTDAPTSTKSSESKTDDTKTTMETASSTGSSASASATDSSDSPSATGGSSTGDDSPSATSGGDSSSDSASPSSSNVAQAAGYKTEFSAIILGAGLVAAFAI